MRFVMFVALVLVQIAAHAATRDVTIRWEQELLTVDGDVLERMDGFRLFTADGVLVQAIPGDVREATIRVNLPWGETCFKMRSFYVHNGIEYESEDYNVGACKTITPGKPVSPGLP